MNPVQLIEQKRGGGAHSPEEITALVRGYVSGSVPDYQMSAWAMAVCWRGMTRDETVALTRAMLESGATLPGNDQPHRVDKHSTGGIGDKTSFILAPLLACCGLKVPMFSGRGLGATGGTLDKIESIAGIRTNLSGDEIEEILATVGCVITGATADLVPADRKLYALRDVTGTIPSVPLITASILSKKLAERLSALVLDVKFGSGAFMKTRSEARALAKSLVEVGRCFGLETAALLTSMNQPNGRLVGNSVEIDESLEILSGRGPDDLRELVLALAAEVLLIKSLATGRDDARELLTGHLDSGRALAKFVQMIEAQGGDLAAPRPRGPVWTHVAGRDGYVAAIDAESLGLSVVEMGGGRKQLGQPIDFGVGLEMLVRLGDRVCKGQPLFNVFATPEARARASHLLEGSITLAPDPGASEPLIAEKVGVDESGRAVLSMLTTAHPAAVLDGESRREIVESALAARQRAYAPYSHFCVGAAVLAESGQIYSGANIENASYGLTLCAERSAIAAALAAGDTKFTAIAVASTGGAAPCGACRQVMAEFCSELPVVLIDAERPAAITEWRLSDLLPGRFSLPQTASNQESCQAGGHEAGQGAAEHGPQA